VNEELGVRVSASKAVEWVSDSLAQGSALAQALRPRVASAAFFVLTTDVSEGLNDFESGKGLDSRETGALTEELLAGLAARGGHLLIVEDDLARKGDLRLPASSTYIQNRVVRWSSLEQDVASAVELLDTGASGYPLNAFVSSITAGALGLEPGVELGDTFVARASGSITHILVSAYDAETLLVCELDDS
jgi:hypothetical protein